MSNSMGPDDKNKALTYCGLGFIVLVTLHLVGVPILAMTWALAGGGIAMFSEPAADALAATLSLPAPFDFGAAIGGWTASIVPTITQNPIAQAAIILLTVTAATLRKYYRSS